MSHGIHHVTAIAGAAARNRAFHERVLGQRLIKRTVNFDDPSSYHLYYGDAAGSPGSILTFFPWANVAAGRPGVGETAETAFRVPTGSLPFWTKRLAAHGIAADPVTERFAQPTMTFADPDGLRLALIGLDDIESEQSWHSTDIPAEHALRGLYGVTLSVADPRPTAAILTDVMGFAPAGADGPRVRFTVDGATLGATVDLRAAPQLPRGRQGGGSVHHVAFRAADDAEQGAMTERLVSTHGLATTEQKDRTYFRSVYLREPNGIIFEIATDAPGFLVDEPADALGRVLKLPAGLEDRRAEIEASLPKLD